MTTTPEHWEMHDIVASHSVARLREFFIKNPSAVISEKQLASDQFLFDLMHVSKAVNPVLYPDQSEISMKYCVDKGLVTKNV